jgi:hypothetical protein
MLRLMLGDLTCLVRHLAEIAASPAQPWGPNGTRTSGKKASHDTAQEKGRATYRYRCDRTGAWASAMFDRRTGSKSDQDSTLVVTRRVGASYQSSLVRGNMSTCAVQSSDALAGGVREGGDNKKKRRRGKNGGG